MPVLKNKLPASLESNIGILGIIDTPKSVANCVSRQIFDGCDIYDVAIQGVQELLVNCRVVSGVDLIQNLHFWLSVTRNKFKFYCILTCFSLSRSARLKVEEWEVY